MESLTSPDIQRRISKLKISYIAVDEAQVWFGLTLAVHKTLLLRKVADPETGWDFRPYSPVLWRWLRATYQGTPFMLSSATLNTESLERIKVSLGIEREEVKVLSSSCDRPNIYQQSRRLHRRLDVGEHLKLISQQTSLFTWSSQEHRQGPGLCSTSPGR